MKIKIIVTTIVFLIFLIGLLLFLFKDIYAFTLPYKISDIKRNLVVIVNPKYFSANKKIQIKPIQLTEAKSLIKNFVYLVTYYNYANYSQKEISINYLIGNKEINSNQLIMNNNAINVPENSDYPNADLFPFQNLNTGIYANYTNPKEITIYKPDNINETDTRVAIDIDLKTKGVSLSQLEGLGVKMIIKSASEIKNRKDIVGTGN